MNLTHKTFLITGGSRGIGLAFAKKNIQQAKEIHLVARSFPDKFKDNFDQPQQDKIHLHSCDLSAESSTLELAEELNKNHPIDIIFNNAGLLTGDLLENIPIKKISATLAVNLNAPILLSRLLLPNMLSNKFGLIINNASVSGEFYFPCAQVYAATKSGLTLFTKSLQMELDGTGVNTLLLVTPGVETKMMDQLKDDYSKHMELDFLSTTITPEEWVEKIMQSIEKNQKVCYPGGSTRVGLFLNRHAPKIFEKIMASKFERNKSTQN